MKAFQVFENLDTNKDERINIFEFMQYVRDEKLDLSNPFREFHLMDKEKDLNVTVEKWIYFYSRNFMTQYWKDLKDTPVMKIFWRSFR